VKQVDSARRKAGPLVWLAADKLAASKLGADCVAGHARVVVPRGVGDLQRPSPLQSPAAHLAGLYGGREVPSNHIFHAIDDPPAATMPRHKKYDWADKKDLCYRLWVEEEKSLPQVQEYFSQALGVAEDCIPSYVLPCRATVLSPHTASNTCTH
jgi:hypothetical protein